MDFTYTEVSSILEEFKDTVTSNRNYQLLYKRYLQKVWDNNINHKVLFCIYISIDDLDNLNFIMLKDALDNLPSVYAIANIIKINCDGEVIDKDYESNNMKSRLESLSLTNYVFFFGENGITRFINGTAVEDNNIFYSREDQMRYFEKKDISKIDEVLNAYEKEYVSEQVNYMSFFADEAALHHVNDNITARNVLKNKPEHFMRDQLLQYLNEHMQYTFTKEPELGQTKRELDIYFDVKGELYFIEVKWLGVSLNSYGTGISTNYTDARAREGVVQTLEYIEELLNTAEASLRHGFLTIFDARDNKKQIDFQEYKFVPTNLMRYLPYFSVLKIIAVDKLHSA